MLALGDNVRKSVDGTASPVITITAPWDEVALTGPEAACLAADPCVGSAVLQSSLPDEALGPNLDLTLRVIDSVCSVGRLRPGLTADRATDLLWLLNGSGVYLHLVHRAGWSPDQYEAWLADSMVDQLLGEPAPALIWMRWGRTNRRPRPQLPAGRRRKSGETSTLAAPMWWSWPGITASSASGSVR